MRKPMFLNMDNLQFGLFKEKGLDADGNGYVRFTPPNSMKKVTIPNVDISENNLITVDKFSPDDGIWYSYRILLTGSGGQCRFGNERLKLKKLTEIIKKQSELIEKFEMERATSRHAEFIASQGEGAILEKIKEQHDIIEPKRGEDLRNRKKRFNEDTGGYYG